jgi:hypothetical protein
MGTENENGVVPPFIEESNQEISPQPDRSFLSQATMLVGLLALALALFGGLGLIWKVLNNGLMNNLEMAIVGMIPIVLAYLVGWGFSVISVRAFSNLVLPLIVRYYSWFTLTGVLVLYLKVIEKLFLQGYHFSNFIAYCVTLLWILLALFGLHLIPEEYDLRPFSIPLFIIGLLQLVMMVIRYVVTPPGNGNGVYVFGDLFIFALMQAIASLMLAHTGMFNPLRQSINDFFRRRGEIFH